MNKAFLYDLLATGSVSGNEAVLEKKFYDYMQDKADKVTVDELGNVTAAINTASSFKVLLAGHADLVGIDDDDIVTGVHVGGVNRLVFAAQDVGDLAGQTAQDDAIRIYHIPFARGLDVLRVSDVGIQVNFLLFHQTKNQIKGSLSAPAMMVAYPVKSHGPGANGGH